MDICAEKCINEKKVRETVKTIPQQEDISQMADIFKALSDPSRLKIVLALLNQEHCVCDIAVICDQTDSAISHQLRILRTMKIVKNRREGKIIYYSIDDDHVISLIHMSLNHVRH
ncbi:metalloregulator ArsR/SmtB family transcription factor [Desulfobacula sp.]|uniref:ArsR/SmtB family transcription factor n=1 Tax=Desulfobacula sp. TaxID=2593537 RepID=UPI002639E419|nr:metalloregulator ArsR/SmtB family transcription factor [Desulfobacula sp.]